MLSGGKFKSEVLRLAKLQYLDKAPEALAHPYYWAGLPPIGDDAAIYSNPFNWWWLVVGITVVALLVYYLKLKQKSPAR